LASVATAERAYRSAVAIADLQAENRQVGRHVRLVCVDVKQRLVGLERLLQPAVRLQANGKPELCARIGVRRGHDALSTAFPAPARSRVHKRPFRNAAPVE
jgi:hypothetical protein